MPDEYDDVYPGSDRWDKYDGVSSPVLALGGQKSVVNEIIRSNATFCGRLGGLMETRNITLGITGRVHRRLQPDKDFARILMGCGRLLCKI